MLAQTLIAELQHEAISTRKMLERIPAEKGDWKPHEKSMSLMVLGGHIADIPAFAGLILKGEELDFAGDAYQTSQSSSGADLAAVFDLKLADAIAALQKVDNDDAFLAMFTLRSGDHVIATLPRIAILRTLLFSHLIHHRGQLSVYLRLLDIPVPSIYGPSADEA